jgi:uncharacterized protein YkwD
LRLIHVKKGEELKFIILAFFYLLSDQSLAQPTIANESLMGEALVKINRIRSTGCRCGRRYFKPVDTVVWNNLLQQSAMDYAVLMHQKRFFGHRGPDGKDIGKRVDDFNYNWKWIGENLGKGQKSIDELLSDWLKSYLHCTLLMDVRMKEMGLANYNEYWTLHMGAR